MKRLFDFKDEIHKCSKCGLCQSVCPVYQQIGNDCAVSRGKFIMLNGVLKGDLKLSNNINSYLDMCLKCNACKDFCPSGIDAREIFIAAKYEFFLQGGFNSKFIKFFNSEIVFKVFMTFVGLFSRLYRLFKLNFIVKCFYKFLNNFESGKKVILANEILTPANCKQAKNKLASNENPLKVVYFKGCLNEFVNPKSKNAVEYLLAQMGAEVLPIDFQCCGVPFLSSGNLQQFLKQACFNISQIPDEFDYFLTDCASCQSAFFDYENYISDEKSLGKLKKINQKSLNAVEFFVQNAKSFEFDEKTTFTFHKPCHLSDLSFLNLFLQKAKNVEYIEMKDFDKCCGFAGEFALKNPDLSEKISAEKAQNAVKTAADYILTSCPSCVLGLNQGLIENDELSKHAINFVEFLACADRIVF